MPVLFPTIYQLIRRSPGTYVNGHWVPAIDSMPEDIQLNIQPANDNDYQRAQIIQSGAGRRVTAMVTATANLNSDLKVAGDGNYPGDIIIYNNKRWLVIGSAMFNSIPNSDTNHMRYLLAVEAEYGAGEIMA